MSLGFRAESTNTSGVITVAGVDQVVINNAGNVAATTFTGALVGNASTATKLSTATVGTAPSYAARAWVAFNGFNDVAGVNSATNTNRFIYGSGNVTNVLRNALGNYTIFFSTPLPTANYAFSISAHHATGVTPSIACSAYSVAGSSIGVFTYITNVNSTYVDLSHVCVTIFQ